MYNESWVWVADSDPIDTRYDYMQQVDPENLTDFQIIYPLPVGPFPGGVVIITPPMPPKPPQPPPVTKGRIKGIIPRPVPSGA